MRLPGTPRIFDWLLLTSCFGCFLSGCYDSRPSPLPLPGEDQETVSNAEEILQNLGKEFGIESKRYEEEFTVVALQIIKLYRAGHPKTALVVSSESIFGTILQNHSPPKWVGKCTSDGLVDLDCLHRKLLQ